MNKNEPWHILTGNEEAAGFSGLLRARPAAIGSGMAWRLETSSASFEFYLCVLK